MPEFEETARRGVLGRERAEEAEVSRARVYWSGEIVLFLDWQAFQSEATVFSLD